MSKGHCLEALVFSTEEDIAITAMEIVDEQAEGNAEGLVNLPSVLYSLS